MLYGLLDKKYLYIKMINKFAFIVPQEDKDFLESRILLAEEKIKEFL